MYRRVWVMVVYTALCAHLMLPYIGTFSFTMWQRSLTLEVASVAAVQVRWRPTLMVMEVGA